MELAQGNTRARVGGEHTSPSDHMHVRVQLLIPLSDSPKRVCCRRIPRTRSPQGLVGLNRAAVGNKHPQKYQGDPKGVHNLKQGQSCGCTQALLDPPSLHPTQTWCVCACVRVCGVGGGGEGAAHSELQLLALA